MSALTMTSDAFARVTRIKGVRVAIIPLAVEVVGPIQRERLSHPAPGTQQPTVRRPWRGEGILQQVWGEESLAASMSLVASDAKVRSRCSSQEKTAKLRLP